MPKSQLVWLSLLLIIPCTLLSDEEKEVVGRDIKIVPAQKESNTTVVDQTGRPLKPAEAAVQSTEKVGAGRRWCLTIGCNTFSDKTIPPLKYSEEDAKKLHELLVGKQAGLFDTNCTTIITGADATRRSILDAVTSISLQAKANDYIFVFFAGHGAVDQTSPIQQTLDNYLVTYDTDMASLKATAISMDEFIEDLLASKARQVIFVMDACHSGAARKGFESADIRPRYFMPPTITPGEKTASIEFRHRFSSSRVGRYLLTACAPNEQSYESSDLQNGILTYFLSKALQGDADDNGDRILTVNEVYDFLRRRVAGYTQKKGFNQNPEIYLARSGEQPMLATTPLKNFTVDAIVMRRRIAELWKRINESQDVFDKKLVEDLKDFCTEYEEDPFAKTAQYEIYKQYYNRTMDLINRTDISLDQPGKLGEWQKQSLSALKSYETEFPESPFLPAVRERAKRIANWTKIKDSDAKCRVPPGKYTLGRVYGGDITEQPASEVFISGFEIDKYEMTNEKFEKFITAGGYDNENYWSDEGWRWKKANRIRQPAFWDDKNLGSNHPNHPVVGVSWYEAQAYSRFAGNARLPTEAEWECAARGTDMREYPWGNRLGCTNNSRTNTSFCANGDGQDGYSDGFPYTAPVDAFLTDKSPSGCLGMAGNVAEWCLDDFDRDFHIIHACATNPLMQTETNLKSIRGGCWSRDHHDFSATRRDRADLRARLSYTGFRLVYPNADDEIEQKIKSEEGDEDEMD